MNDPRSGVPLGTLAGDAPSYVSDDGSVLRPDGIHASWLVIGEDQLHDPADAPTRRQRDDGAVVDTAIRVHAGDFNASVFAVPGSTVIEFSNGGEAAVAVGLVIEGSLDAVTWARDPAQMATGPTRAAVRALVAEHRTMAFSSEPNERRATASALVWPLAHGASLRIALGDPAGLDHDPASVRRAWAQRLRSGLRVDIDDRNLQDAIDRARIAILAESSIADGEIVHALEGWGFDAEAARAWDRLGFRARRTARRRGDPRTAWARLTTAQTERPSATLLNAMRDLVVTEERAGVAIVPEFPTAWLGLALAVHDVPLNRGLLSFALRWHGRRPALLWELSEPMALRCPALAPGWSTTERSGETLFAEPPGHLVDLATAAEPSSSGDATITTSFD